MMSGTSLDGVDAALVETDGEAARPTGAWLTVPYAEEVRAAVRAVLGGRGDVLAAERAVTLAHAEAAERLLADAGVARDGVAAIGFHGQTIVHRPSEGLTWQLGDGWLLAARTGIDVVCDFRRGDLAAGGEGAPLAPLYHAARAGGLERPLAVLNVGGVANVTWIGTGGEAIAFDTGPGGALLDDWVRRHTGAAFDRDGALAAQGRADMARVEAVLAGPYFARRPPKSLDRDAFGDPAAGLAPADGAATLAALTAAAVAAGVRHLPAPPARWLVTGGGRLNPTIMAALRARLGVPVDPVEAVGWNGDALEAEAFAYLAVRSLRGLPVSLPATTGARRPAPGGVLCRAR